MRTEQGQAGWPGSVGEYWWAGYGGTLFWVDPAEELIVIYMSQQTHNRRVYRRKLRYLVSQAVDIPAQYMSLEEPLRVYYRFKPNNIPPSPPTPTKDDTNDFPEP